MKIRLTNNSGKGDIRTAKPMVQAKGSKTAESRKKCELKS